MIRTGLYLNDLSLHDFSRDMVLLGSVLVHINSKHGYFQVLAGQQQTAELKLALGKIYMCLRIYIKVIFMFISIFI